MQWEGWVRRTATLTESAGWRVSSLSGRIPTGTEFQAVHADLQGIFIESDLAGGADTGFLDNVVMVEQPGIPPNCLATHDPSARLDLAPGNLRGRRAGKFHPVGEGLRFLDFEILDGSAAVALGSTCWSQVPPATSTSLWLGQTPSGKPV